MIILTDENKIIETVSSHLDIPIYSCSFIRNGWEYLILEINNELIFRFPRSQTIYNRLLEEVEKLTFLSEKISAIQIPKMKLLGKKGQLIFSKHKKINGKQATLKDLNSWSQNEKDRLADDISSFFAEFHKIPKEDVQKSTGLKKTYPTIIFDQLFDKEFEAALNLFNEDEQKKIRLIKEKIEHLDIGNDEFVFGHFDFTKSNSAIDLENHKINGVFDFSHCGIKDFNLEFRAIFQSFPIDIAKSIIEKYQIKTNHKTNLERIVLYNQAWLFQDVITLVKMQDIEKIADVKTKFLQWLSTDFKKI